MEILASPPGTIGADIAARYPERYGRSRHEERQPCPLCGHPTGDCSIGDHEAMMATAKKKAVAKKAAAKAAPKAAAPRKAKAAEGPTVQAVVGRVYFERPAPGAPDSNLRFLKFYDGQVVSQEELDAARAEGLKVKVRAVEATDF